MRGQRERERERENRCRYTKIVNTQNFSTATVAATTPPTSPTFTDRLNTNFVFHFSSWLRCATTHGHYFYSRYCVWYGIGIDQSTVGRERERERGGTLIFYTTHFKPLYDENMTTTTRSVFQSCEYVWRSELSWYENWMAVWMTD